MSPQIIQIHSENNDFQHIDVLKRNRNKRAQYNEFFVEGVKSIEAALKNNWQFNSVYFSSEKGLSSWGKDVVAKCGAKKCYDLPRALLEKLSDKEDASEILAAVKTAEDDLSRIKIHDGILVVVLDRPASPRNLGTSIRSCDCLGSDAVIVTGHAADIYHPQAVRGSMGALFSIPVLRLPSQNELFSWIEEVRNELGHIQVVGTSAKAKSSPATHDFKQPTVIVLGNEKRGLSAAYKELCDYMLKIPQGGFSSSINVSCALSIMLYEIQRQRTKA